MAIHPSRKFNQQRRQLLGATALAMPALLLPSQRASASVARERSVLMHHTHTGEKLSLVYLENGEYVDEALAEVNHFLRDFRTGEVHAINPVLLDRLHEMRRLTRGSGAFQIISGFRSSKTNEMLRNRSSSSGVAKKSHHMTGDALDVRLVGFDTRKLRDVAKSLRAGGVGYYAKSDFIHIDTGRVRAW